MRSFIKALFIFALISLFSASSTKKTDFCRILALQGGGDKGSYQAGALKGLIDNLPAEEITWDIVSGISVGSINSYAMSLFKKGDEKAAIEMIVDLWLQINGSSDIYQNWNIFGFLYEVFFKQGAYDNAPLRDYLLKAARNRTIQRTLTVGATSISNGQYHRFTNMTLNEAIDAVMASSAYPGAFPPKKIGNDSYVDGGISYSIDVSAAIDLCKAQGHPEENITIDVILCNRDELDWNKGVNSLHIIIEAVSLMMHEFRLRDIEKINSKYPLAKFRYFVEPSKPIGDLIPLNFNPKSIRNLLDLGYSDAVNVIKKGKGKVVEEKLLKANNKDAQSTNDKEKKTAKNTFLRFYN